MKFLVLALCVCAASAASYGARPYQQQQQQGAKAFAQTIVTVPEVVTLSKNVVAGPVVAAKAVAIVPEVIAKPVYNAAKDAYNTATNLYRNKEAESEITRYSSDMSDDEFHYVYETSNGISAEANGAVKNVDKTNVQVIKGSYRYVDPNGYTVVVQYTADENGFRPQSDVLPTSPPIPDAILRSLEWIRLNPRKEDN